MGRLWSYAFCLTLLLPPTLLAQSLTPEPSPGTTAEPFPVDRGQPSASTLSKRRKRQPDFVNHFHLESFGFGAGAQALGYEFSPEYAASFFHLQGFECPDCILGAPNRTRFTLPPFGAKATYTLWNGRVQLFGLSGGTEAWKPTITVNKVGYSSFPSTYEDSWLLQAEGGARVAVDRSHRLWLGGSARESYQPISNIQQKWATFTGSAEFTFGRK